MIKVKNNAGKVIEVSQKAWDILYSNRKGFSLYVEEVKDVTVKEPTQKTPKKVAPKKKTPPIKKVKKDEKSK